MIIDLKERGRYNTLKKEEQSRVWEAEKNHKLRRLQGLTPTIPEEINGIPLSDQKLEDQHGTPVVEVVALGGIVPTENMKAFLRLPLKFRCYQKIDREEAVVQAEGRAARQRWVLRDKELVGPETFDQYRRRKERIEDEKLPEKGNKHVDFTRIPVTQLLCNKFIQMPSPASPEQEIRIQSEKLEILDTWDLHVRDHVDDNGYHKGSNNLTRQQAEGRKEIQQGIKDRGWCLYGTDKSGKLVLDTQQNFLDSMKPHFEDHEEVDYDAVLYSEKTLNNHSKAWAKVLNVGLNAGQTHPRRIREALTVKHSNVAHLRGLRKDHKTSQDPVSGPPLRPLCNGNIGPNAPLGNLMARLLRTVRSGVHQKIPTEILSTEELLSHLDLFNSEVQEQREQPAKTG